MRARCFVCCRGGSAGQVEGRWTLDGDDSIRRRPVDRVRGTVAADGSAGSNAATSSYLPAWSRERRSKESATSFPVASAQVKSCVLLAGLLAVGETTVIERLPTRNHTELMLKAAGAAVQVSGTEVTIEPAERLRLDEVMVPADFSSAAFFIAAATLVPGSELTLERVGINPTRTGLLNVLERMGGKVEV